VHEIVDIGIYDLLKPPHQHSKEKLRAWERLETGGWKVVPDCPDLQGEFGISEAEDNLEYSMQLLDKYYTPEDPHHLAVIQSHYQNIRSFRDSIAYFKDTYGVPDKLAVGSICKADDNMLAVRMLKIIRREFPDTWIHAFGLRFQQFRKAYKFIDSYDSTSWTFPRSSGRPSCKNKAMRIEYFWEYVDCLKQYDVNGAENLLSFVI
jgi:hypothetical protein